MKDWYVTVAILFIASYPSLGYQKWRWKFPDATHSSSTYVRDRQAASLRLHDIPIKTDAEVLRTKQFEQFSKNQVGKWIGVHTGYDPAEITVADHLYVESLLEPIDEVF